MTKKILIADADKEIREFFKLIFFTRCELFLTDSGLQMLSFLKNATDIELILASEQILTDNNFEILKEIRNNNPNLAVFLLSKNKQNQKISEAITLGIQGFLEKPLREKKILEELNSFLPNIK